MITFTIPAPCEPINSNDRLHYHVKAKRTAAWRARAHVAAIQAGRPKLQRAHIWALVARTDNRSSDVCNYYPTVKAAVDGLVRDGGCLPDDSNTYVVGPDMRPTTKAAKFTLVITLDPDCTCADCAERFGGEAA